MNNPHFFSSLFKLFFIILKQETNSKTLVGTWEFESQENFDEFLKEMGTIKISLKNYFKQKITFLINYKGVGFFIRQFASLSRPSLIISNEGDYWTIKRNGGPKETPPITFKNNEEFIEQGNH